ncbi:hypothetical protein [Azospirillum palustre]
MKHYLENLAFPICYRLPTHRLALFIDEVLQSGRPTAVNA